MKRHLLIALLFWPAVFAGAQGLRLEIRSLPPSHPPGAAIYLAGSFNRWDPADTAYRFKTDGSGQYYLQTSLPAGAYEFKLTRGSWQTVECKKGGGGLPNRSVRTEGPLTLPITVEEWQDKAGAGPRVSTASAGVRILRTDFYMPKLKRHRRVWIYLPEDYAVSGKRYPVLYLHDGQNVFEDTSSFAGEWGVDEMMDTTRSPRSIVVAIDNGGSKRINEYSPYDMEKFGKGEGALYLRFIVKNLKPYIDRHYRTLRGREHTFIAGSSMGGLISFCALLQYPRVFGGAGIFSPAFWVAPSVYRDIPARGKKVRARVYFYAGKQESETMVPLLLQAFGQLHAESPSPLRVVIRDQGRHTEPDWRREFPFFYDWLMRR